MLTTYPLVETQTAALCLRSLKQVPIIEVAGLAVKRAREIPSNPQEFVATYLTYKWRDKRGNVSTLKTLIAMRMAGQGHATSIATAKIQALNLGINIAGRSDRLIAASKYTPHVGKKEAEKAAKRAAKLKVSS